MTIHLTEQGFNAGRRLCGSSRLDNERNVHAAYAPLENAMFLSECCPSCLLAYAKEAYEEGDTMPEWVKRMRNGLFGI